MSSARDLLVKLLAQPLVEGITEAEVGDEEDVVSLDIEREHVALEEADVVGAAGLGLDVVQRLSGGLGPDR